MTRTRLFLGAAAVVAVAATVTVAVLVTGGDDPVQAPYRDGSAAGTVGFCGKDGRSVRSGSVADGPFVWRAVGSTAARPAAGATATLYAFQPRAGVDPGQWSGRQLTAASRYTDARHPMAQSTSADTTLQSFLTAYPAGESGFVQVRLYLAAPGEPTSTTRYDATDVRVTGSTWQVVGGDDSVSCAAGSAISLEDDVRPTGTTSPSR